MKWSQECFKSFLGIDGKVKKIIHAARQVGREGFADMLDEVEGHIDGHQKLLRNEGLGNWQSHLQRKRKIMMKKKLEKVEPVI